MEVFFARFLENGYGNIRFFKNEGSYVSLHAVAPIFVEFVKRKILASDAKLFIQTLELTTSPSHGFIIERVEICKACTLYPVRSRCACEKTNINLSTIEVLCLRNWSILCQIDAKPGQWSDVSLIWTNGDDRWVNSVCLDYSLLPWKSQHTSYTPQQTKDYPDDVDQGGKDRSNKAVIFALALSKYNKGMTDGKRKRAQIHDSESESDVSMELKSLREKVIKNCGKIKRASTTVQSK